jgi:hypothetical protein
VGLAVVDEKGVGLNRAHNIVVKGYFFNEVEKHCCHAALLYLLDRVPVVHPVQQGVGDAENSLDLNKKI